MNYLFDVFGVLWNIESPFELHVSFSARVAVIDLLLIFDNLQGRSCSPEFRHGNKFNYLCEPAKHSPPKAFFNVSG